MTEQECIHVVDQSIKPPMSRQGANDFIDTVIAGLEALKADIVESRHPDRPAGKNL